MKQENNEAGSLKFLKVFMGSHFSWCGPFLVGIKDNAIKAAKWWGNMEKSITGGVPGRFPGGKLPYNAKCR